MTLRWRKQLKKKLGSQYDFRRLISEREIAQIQKRNPPGLELQTVAFLIIGCMKIEAVLYKQNGRMRLGYDVFVKDTPDSPEWVCYDSLQDPVQLGEAAMFTILDHFVRQNHLSYTDCRFPSLAGKTPDPWQTREEKQEKEPAS